MHFTLIVRCLLLAPVLAWATQLSAGAELQPVPEDTFSIAVIPDTQKYVGSGTKLESDSTNPVTNPTFEAYTDWICDNMQGQQIKFITHVGDIVDKNVPEQWAVAQRCMDKLHGVSRYGLAVGNHDMTPSSGDSSLFQQTFPRSRFDEYSWYDGCFMPLDSESKISGDNANSVQLFYAGGMNFAALHLECNAPDEVLLWADAMLDLHSDRRAIITTHMGLGPLEKPEKSQDYFDAPKGRMRWKKCHGYRGNTPQEMWDKCFTHHRNIFMICCGDQSRTQAMRQESTGKYGNVVHELLSDYGVHGLRVMRFLPAENKIEVRTWDPINGKLCESTEIVPERSAHQFELTYDMSERVTKGE